MKETIKKLLKSGIEQVVDIADKTSAGRYLLEEALNAARNRTWSIRYHGLDLTFAVPNRLTYLRIDTFATKEPETLEWIDGMPEGSMLWDIGANVGLYTCYAAKARRCSVFAFEPSVFNLELLARNVFLNQLSEQVTLVSLPLSSAVSISTLNMTSTEWGGALSTFGQTYGCDGQTLRKVFCFRTVGISMIQAVEVLEIPQPDYIKIDVDGIEHLILQGGAGVLKNVKSVLVEINEEFERQFVESERYLSSAGLILKEKRHSSMFDDTIFKNTYNQIWHRA